MPLFTFRTPTVSRFPLKQYVYEMLSGSPITLCQPYPSYSFSYIYAVQLKMRGVWSPERVRPQESDATL